MATNTAARANQVCIQSQSCAFPGRDRTKRLRSEKEAAAAIMTKATTPKKKREPLSRGATEGLALSRGKNQRKIMVYRTIEARSHIHFAFEAGDFHSGCEDSGCGTGG